MRCLTSTLVAVIVLTSCQSVEPQPRTSRPSAAMSATDWVFSASESGAPGPALDVQVQQVKPDSYLVTARADGKTRSAEVTAEQLPAFHIVSRGGAGAPGVAGEPGLKGRDAAPCEHGGDGGPGGDGGAGGAGGPGGTVSITVSCGATACSPRLLALLEANIVSQGGAGGSGGTPGPGGRRGYGGIGRITEALGGGLSSPPLVKVGCEAGVEGNPGEPGRSGRDGAPGAAGARTISVAP